MHVLFKFYINMLIVCRDMAIEILDRVPDNFKPTMLLQVKLLKQAIDLSEDVKDAI